MRLSVATSVIATTNSLVLAAPTEDNPSSTGLAPKNQEEILSGIADNKSTPIVRKRRSHWTLLRSPVEDVKNLQDSLPFDSAVLTNQKEGKSVNKGTRDGLFYNEDQDLGILSSSRLLEPLDVESSSPSDSEFFDSFTAFDRDRTAFYSLCDATVEDEYFCPRCDTNSTEKTVADFECEKVSCYQVYSRCPNNRMVVCRYDTLSRFFDYEPVGDASVPYSSEKCRKIEARLSKTNRPILPTEESSWDFEYCLRYNIASLPEDEAGDTANTCEMEIDGVVCSGCSLETVTFSDSQQQFCVNFDCGNTLLGYSGRFCNDASLASVSIDYFIYRSLPCDGGCNLCGEDDDPALMRMMTFPESSFDTPTNSTTQFLNTVGLPETLKCFETQWLALTTTSGLVCTDLESAVEESCGCAAIGVPTPVVVDDSENITATEEETVTAGAMLPTRVSELFASLAAGWLIGFGIL